MIQRTIPCKGYILLPICLIKFKNNKQFHLYLIISNLAISCKKLQFYLHYIHLSVSEIESEFIKVYENKTKTTM